MDNNNNNNLVYNLRWKGMIWNNLTLTQQWEFTYSVHKDNIDAHSFVRKALITNDTNALEVIFEYLNVPDNLTIKEKICYWQLLGNC